MKVPWSERAAARVAAAAAAARRRREAMLAHLEQLVGIESPSEEREHANHAADALAQRAAALGMVIERIDQDPYADTLVARIGDPKGSGPRILLVGHYDTVYPLGTLDTRPFRLAGGIAQGPGVFDMKGGLVIGLTALEALVAERLIDGVVVSFVMNGDEEPGSPRSREVIQKEAAGCDLALILEPGRPGPALTLRRKGVGIFHLRVQGVEAHAGADPHNGVNAIVDLASKAIQLYELNDSSRGSTVTPGVFHGGTQPYVVPGLAELAFDARVDTLEEQRRLLAAFERIAEHEYIAGTQTVLTGSFHRPPMEPSQATEELLAQMRAVADQVGYPLGIGSSGGASDGNLTAAAGLRTIDGVGAHGGRAHSADEYVEVESLPGKAAVLAGFLALIGSE